MIRSFVIGVCTAPKGAAATCAAGTCGFTCPAGTADCDGNTANGCETVTDTDGNNCGGCGHTCGAATCAAGLCAPTMIAHAVGSATVYGLPVDANNVYWAEYQHTTGNIRATPKAQGGAVLTLANYQAGPVEVAVDGATLFFANYDEGTVKSVPVDGSAAAKTLFSNNAHFPQRLRVSGGKVYWSAWDGTVNRMAEDGTNPIVIANEQDYPFGLAVDGSTIFWPTRMLVRSSPDSAGATPMQIAGNLAGTDSLDVDADNAHTTTNADGRVLKLARNGSGSPQTLASGAKSTTKLIVDKGMVYYRTDSQIVRVATSGGRPLPLANSPQSASSDGGLALDGTDVYFVDDRGNLSHVGR